MSRSFTTTDRVAQGTAAIPTTGSLAFWYWPTYTISDGIAHYIVQVDAGTGTSYFMVVKFSDNKLYAGWYTGGVEKRVVLAAGSTGLVQNAWNHVCLTWTSGGTTELWVNGVSKGTTATLSTWNTAGRDRIIGNNGVPANYINPATGRMAEFALWNTVLSHTDIGMLAGTYSGTIYSPGVVAAGSLVDYLKLLGSASPEPNASGGTAGTVTGTTQTNHLSLEYALDYPAASTLLT